MNREEVIAVCVEYLMNTKDFCGDVTEAFRELKEEHSLSETEVREIQRRANSNWLKSQCAAGVKKKYRHFKHF